MADEKTCPHCGKPVPPTALGGLCPECMLKAGLAAQTEGPGGVGPQGTKVVQPPPSPAEIASLFPQLEILECLGRGGMGVVYKARQPRLNRLVALKILARDKEQDGQFAERFTREAQTLARLNHPNIVTVHDFGEAGGHCYLVMEFVDGLNLRQLLLTRKMPPDQALTIVPKICEALQYAHEQGIVHRDIKPENILLDKQGRVKIADFGIAKMLGVEAGHQALTGAKDVVGTPHYMAPEQLEKPLTVDHRADIYSLGVVFYEMLTGELPLGKFAPPSKKVQIDVRLDEVVLHTLEKEPARRYQQANQLKTDVETIAGTPGITSGAGADAVRAGWLRSQLTKVQGGQTVVNWTGASRCWSSLFGILAFVVILGWFGTKQTFPLAGALGCAAFAAWAVVTVGIGLMINRFWIPITTVREGKTVLDWMGASWAWGGIFGTWLFFVLLFWFSTEKAFPLAATLVSGALAAAIIVGLCAMRATSQDLSGKRAAAAVAGQTPAAAGQAISDKILLPTFLLAFFFGVFGAHRFYIGKIWTAFLQLAALGGCALLIIACATLGTHGQPVTGILLGFLSFGCIIWATIDWILIVCKAFTDGQGRRITNWLHPQTNEMKTGFSPLTGPPSTPPSTSPPTSPPGGTAPLATAPAPAPMAQKKMPANGTGKIVAPAVGLMVAGMLKLSSALTALFFLASLNTGWLGTMLENLGIGPFSHWEVLPGFSIVLLKVVPACLILFGGLQMLQLRSYAWAIAAGILAIVCCSLVGFPVGIWALIILARQDVRETFANAAASPSPKTGNKWPWVLGTAAVASVIAIGLMIAVVLALRPTSGNPNMTVRGTVTDAVTGKPIAGARVDDNRYGADSDRTPQQAWTDVHGHYELKTWYEEHTIAASAPGYENKLSLLRTKVLGSEREKRMDFKLQPQGATPAYQRQTGTNDSVSPAANLSIQTDIHTIDIPLTNHGSVMTSNISSPDGQVVIETTNGRLSADKAQLQADTNGAPNLTGRKIESEPAIAPKPTAIAPAVQSEPHVQRIKIIGNLLTKDEFQQDFNQTLPLTADGRLSLNNVNGKVEISGWDRDEVAIQAVKHGKTKENAEELEIKVDAHPDHITIHTQQPESWFGWNKDSVNVDYTIQVPRHARLANISSVNGQIAIDGVSGNIEASTVNGRLQIQGAVGDLKLSTVNGRIEAELTSLGGSQTVSLKTVNGHIEAILPANADAEVSASTVNGGMSSEFSSLIVKKEFPLGRHLKGTLGSGGARVKASTVNGRINFRKGKDVQ